MPTVLLVDDSATDRAMIGGMLRKSGMQVRLAENGSGALKQLSGSLPDVVLTDMQMPEMNGLELVQAIRMQYPLVPVILMTGHGSEALAARALQEGAASYVPKSQANEILIDCVNRLVQIAAADSEYDRLIDHAQAVDFQFTLDNDVTLIPPLLTLVKQMIGGLNVSDPTGQIQVGVALEEALTNAINHGNLELTTEQLEEAGDGQEELVAERRGSEPYSGRRCYVRCHINRDEAKIQIRDEGPGFDVQNCLDISVNDESSRGLVLMWGLMDKVSFNTAGNEVTLVKRRQDRSKLPAESEDAKAGADTAAVEKLGELISVDGGPSIPLTSRRLSVGRDPACDVCLPHSDVSHQHCLLYMYGGWWYVKDLKSANGIRINRISVDQRRISPGAILSIGTHRFEVQYNPSDLGAVGITPPVDPF
ncbi:MAG: response regulator [Planctomycetales bacterium]|nr:response regulator [Planctomycetales bacterium]